MTFKDIRKINDNVWEIPKTYKPGMLVPARIYANEKIARAMDEGVYNQITNVACLPGILKYAYCMPDGHWGYGFPIGGVAAFDMEKGVISPGGIGFDINCVHPDTKIMTRHGYFKKIKAFSGDFSKESISFMDLGTKQSESGSPELFMRKESDTPIVRIRTKSGQDIVLSTDHPLLTGYGYFKESGELREGDKIVTYPFAGVEYEEPNDEIILDEDDIIRVVGNRPKLISELREKDLIPLRYSSEKLPILARLVGFLTGDGWIGTYYSKKRKMDIWSTRAIGHPDDLETVRNDIVGLGYEANYIATKEYTSKVSYADGTIRKVSGKSTQMHINSQSLSALLHVLGVPKGNKSRVKTSVPEWVKKSPLWIKRLYLAGLFGAELTKPVQRKGEPYGFIEPSFSQNKINALERDNLNFLLDIVNLLLEFGITTNKIYRQKGVVNSYGEETHKLALRISANQENLIKLWETVGFEYCRERTNLSMLSLAYLNYKKSYLMRINKTLKRIKNAIKNGQVTEEIYTEVEKHGLDKSLIDNKLKRNGKIRITHVFPKFGDFVNMYKIENSPFVMDEIGEIEKIDYEGFVYDFTMGNKNHNFIANSIVSHNCGMRLVLTNLTLKDVQPKIKELVNNLFDRVPAGVGSSGFLKPSRTEFRDIVERGAEWCIEQGYGWKEDLERTEEDGVMKGADASKVSDKAIKRGLTQIGTLGSGNHYLEIQAADKIFDEETARKFGVVEKDQIVIMFHCGSRGFGHQIGTDYLQTFLKVMPKYGIKVLDPELACAPFRSKEGQDYYKAMCCGINMSFANRQVILHRIREVFSKVMKQDAESLGLHQVYDVAHNTAKIEKHRVNGEEKEVLVHRKGSTRAFGPGREEVPKIYRDVGQPVIIGGSMETGSYLLVGTEKAELETFGSTCHGSGRTMSRARAKGLWRGDRLLKDMEQRGIYVRSVSMSGVAEEAGGAYKDIDEVIESVHSAGITLKVVKLRPIGNVKG